MSYWDNHDYERDVGQMRTAVSVGHQQLQTPRADTHRTFQTNPRLRGAVGVSLKENIARTDVESDLQGHTRATNRDCRRTQNPADNVVNSDPQHHYPDSYIHIDESQFTNPACTLRGTGVNRWAWLPHDPQASALPEFDIGVSSRIVNKDNHRPLLPTPLPGSSGQPAGFQNVPKEDAVGNLSDMRFRQENKDQDRQLRKIEVVRRMPTQETRGGDVVAKQGVLSGGAKSWVGNQKAKFASLETEGPTAVDRLPFAPKYVAGPRP